MKIDAVEVFPMCYPTKGYFKFFKGAFGQMGRAAVTVKVTADDGTVGWGQSVPIVTWSYETLETATIVLRDYFGPSLIGIDPLDRDAMERTLNGVLANGFSTGMPISRSGLDIATHDLAGKLQGKSLAELWGRPVGDAITLSWTLNPKSLDETERLIDEGRQQGYRHFNIKVGPDPDFDVLLARQVRQNAPDAFLWADANGGYELDDALRAAPLLADVGVDVLEAPLRPNRFRGYQALKQQGALPILMDEGVVSVVELEEFIRLGMIDGVAMKPSRCGGLHSARRQIELLEQEGLMWLGSGLADPDISLAATLGLYAAYGLTRPAALNGPQFLAADVLASPIVTKNGTLEVPNGPGLGIEVDESKLIDLMQPPK
ncbi:mandelate racemase/muconate lactonizing enzyme family protein [Novipirellula artificiosorum]|uniref:O-succinylbenzoate synthase n=1 Tax=Novipirellula artificiosorum TaxID=2528016 RepID=A0A5C6DFA0_9BACT|nr:enolase C-terminal domain-like protein [Novipirellula artificiosorum]TWU35923.1 o-succinylbenzoate synthase [Novipirellula artificiosorum]